MELQRRTIDILSLECTQAWIVNVFTSFCFSKSVAICEDRIHIAVIEFDLNLLYILAKVYVYYGWMNGCWTEFVINICNFKLYKKENNKIYLLIFHAKSNKRILMKLYSVILVAYIHQNTPFAPQAM